MIMAIIENKHVKKSDQPYRFLLFKCICFYIFVYIYVIRSGFLLSSFALHDIDFNR